MYDLTGENIYFVSDTHFNHHKLCSSYPDHFDHFRKYKTVNEMNDDIIEQWNKTITKNDLVIFLGDFAFGRPWKYIPEIAQEMYKKLNYKGFIWIEGNHDEVIKHKFNKLIPNLKFKYNDGIYLCQHEDYKEKPEFYEQNKDATHLIHGHTHLFERTSKTIDNKIQNNVCWEAWYRPVHISEIVSKD